MAPQAGEGPLEYPELSRRQDGSSQLFCIRRKFERFPWEGPLNGSALAGVRTRNDGGLTPVCCGSGPVEIGAGRGSARRPGPGACGELGDKMQETAARKSSRSSHSVSGRAATQMVDDANDSPTRAIVCLAHANRATVDFTTIHVCDGFLCR
jgi:hypothetical protein